ncbi:MAG: CidA/LrgA family protein [Aurantimonas endophytica]|uniref:Holin-like protein n=1 Tax=Aurantimonas endophytica TaxID=1522175 RepID=A0A7W6HBM8_9HYPH|nr:CidA/LrgA family protein [Aurantimonas endophytica]MBB4002181.1 holin-like protein [Aurantimonas endophytica]MCO6402190.1 CidA/LrgA family protein [Aurantimonas endophytica]
MLQALTAIFACQLAGEAITVALGLPLPGPVIGMALLFSFLLLRKSVPASLGKVGDGLLANLSLLFVPAGAGIMMHAGRLEGEALSIGLTLVVSTLATIAVTALVMNRLGPGRRERSDG